ncbi:MAG TPA: RHS repeat-associated core domain-containing protein [Anaerolineales bacterium]|jgi:RHS repeat-associated protein
MATSGVQNLAYTYDAVGNISTISDTVTAETHEYSYDTVERLTGWRMNNVLQEEYSYDPATGKLASKAGVTYTYDGSHKQAVASLSNGNSYLYDASGNQVTRNINGQTFTLGYDADNRMVSVTGPSMNASFVYDGNGKRVKSVINGVGTVFVGNYYELVGGAVTKYYFLGSQRVALRQGGALYYPLTDHLGSTSVTTDSLGNAVAELRYTPWGETRLAGGTTPSKYQFTGQYNEGELGLYYYNARWYDGLLGRFVQADTIVPPGAQGLDRYAAMATGGVQNLTYTYDAVGNITQIVDKMGAETHEYSYDRLGRLSQLMEALMVY